MVNLRKIAAAFADKPELTPGARAQANNDITGIIFLNGFAGRCMEWAPPTSAHFQEQVEVVAIISCARHTKQVICMETLASGWLQGQLKQ